MTLRIEIDDLPEDVRHAIEAGEAVEIVRDGCTVATVAGVEEETDSVWARLAALPPLDDDYEKDIAYGLSILRPQPYAWE